MTFYVDPPDAGPVQGIWHYRPAQDDWPNSLCDRAKEGMTITDLASARRFFQEKCCWSWRGVRGITEVVFLEGQTWRAHGTIIWPTARRRGNSGSQQEDGEDSRHDTGSPTSG
jgi:hypothetical protein